MSMLLYSVKVQDAKVHICYNQDQTTVTCYENKRIEVHSPLFYPNSYECPNFYLSFKGLVCVILMVL